MYRVMRQEYSHGTLRDRPTGDVGEQSAMWLRAAELAAEPWRPVAVDERKPVFFVEHVSARPVRPTN
jgi:hypothetical protein